MAEEKTVCAVMEYSNNLPLEIIEIVLLKLPVKSLLRFKTVCTSWNTIISDPVFTRIHLENSNNSPNNNDNLFLTEKGDTERGFSLFKLEGGKLHADRVSENPSGNMVILCECNGVLLLRDSSGGVNNTSNYVLWNPSTRRVRCFDDPYGSTVNYGLCYDPITDDFKVVVMKRSSYSIFSCNSDSWTEVEESRSYDSVGWSGVFADGALYWLFCFEMARFDPTTDELEALRKPEQLGDYDEFSLGCLRGRLCLYCNNTGDDERGIRIWIKEKNSNDWEAFVAIENVPTNPIRSIKFLHFVGNKILIGLYCTSFGLYYCPSEKTVEKIIADCGMDLCRLVPYQNSLYFPAVKTKTLSG